MIIEATDKILEKNIGKTVVLDCYATWCGPCKMLKPIYAQVAQELAGSHPDVVFASLDIDQYKEFAKTWEVQSIPTIIIFKDNKEVKRHTGFMNKLALEKFLLEG